MAKYLSNGDIARFIDTELAQANGNKQHVIMTLDRLCGVLGAAEVRRDLRRNNPDSFRPEAWREFARSLFGSALVDVVIADEVVRILYHPTDSVHGELAVTCSLELLYEDHLTI